MSRPMLCPVPTSSGHPWLQLAVRDEKASTCRFPVVGHAWLMTHLRTYAWPLRHLSFKHLTTFVCQTGALLVLLSNGTRRVWRGHSAETMPASESVLGLDNTPQVREAAETTGNKLPNPEQNHLTDAGKASKEQGNRHPTKPTAVAAPMMQVGKSLAIPSSTSTTQEFNTSAAPSTPLTVGRTFPQNSSADMLALVQNPALLAATAATQDNGSFVQQQQMILEAQLALAHEQRKARDALAQQLMEQEQQRQQQLLLMSLNQHQASQLLANSAFSVPKSVNSNRQLNAEAPEQSQHQIQEQLSRIQQATDVANAISLLQAKTTGQPQAQPSKPVSGPMPTGSPIAQPAAVSQAHAPLGINGSNSLMESLILLGNPGMARMIEAEGLKVSPEMLLTASLASQLPLASVASGPQQLYQQLVSSAQHRMMSSSEIDTGHIYDEDHASKRRRTEAAELQAPQPSHMLGLQRANTPAQLQALLHSQDGSQLLSKALANMKGTNPHIHQGVPSPQTPHALSPTDKKRKTGMVAPAPLIIHVPSKDGKPTGRKMPASGKNKAEEQRVRGSKSSEPAESAVKGRTWWPRRTELCFRDITKLENPPKLSQTSTLRGIYYRSNGRYKARNGISCW
eukprot:scaffold3242_cov351-Prasinococcus_capsulatus_cf.AAC.3